jgi:glucose-1-phosphatase
VLSNSNPLHWQRLIDDYGLARPFEALFVSHELGQRKPDAAAYQIVSNQLDQPVEDFIFFDDNPECVEAARELGMQAHQVRGLAQLSQALKELGALPADNQDH